MTGKFYSSIEFDDIIGYTFPYKHYAMKMDGKTFDFKNIIKMPSGLLNKYEADPKYMKLELYVFWKACIENIKAGKNPTVNALKIGAAENMFKEFADDFENISDVRADADSLSKCDTDRYVEKAELLYKWYKRNGFVSENAWMKENWGCTSNAMNVVIRHYPVHEKIYFITEGGFPEKIFKKILDVFTSEIAITEVHFDETDPMEDYYIRTTSVPGNSLERKVYKDEKSSMFRSLDHEFSNIYPHIFVDR